EAVADRVRRRNEDDRDDRCYLLCGEDCRGSRRDDDIDLEPDELGRDLGVALYASLRPAILDRDGASFGPTKFPPPLHNRGHPWAIGRRRARAQEPDGRQLARRLRTCREWPSDGRPSEKHDQLTASHLIKPSPGLSGSRVGQRRLLVKNTTNQSPRMNSSR